MSRKFRVTGIYELDDDEVLFMTSDAGVGEDEIELVIPDEFVELADIEVTEIPG